MDASFREARKTGGGSNTSGMIGDEDVLIVAADKRMTTSDRIRDLCVSTPAFGRISGAVDNFVVPHGTQSQLFRVVLLYIPQFRIHLKLNKKSRN